VVQRPLGDSGEQTGDQMAAVQIKPSKYHRNHPLPRRETAHKSRLARVPAAKATSGSWGPSGVLSPYMAGKAARDGVNLRRHAFVSEASAAPPEPQSCTPPPNASR